VVQARRRCCAANASLGLSVFSRLRRYFHNMADQAVFKAFVKKVKTERTSDTDASKLYAEDTCCLKSNPSKIGLVDVSLA
jgi:hypothetical protein